MTPILEEEKNDVCGFQGDNIEVTVGEKEVKLWSFIILDFRKFIGGLEDSRRAAVNHLVRCTWIRQHDLWSIGEDSRLCLIEIVL